MVDVTGHGKRLASVVGMMMTRFTAYLDLKPRDRMQNEECEFNWALSFWLAIGNAVDFYHCPAIPLSRSVSVIAIFLA
jgi:hypothetical protein